MDVSVGRLRKHAKNVDEALAKLAHLEVLEPDELRYLLVASKPKDYKNLVNHQIVLMYGLQLRLQARLEELMKDEDIVHIKHQRLLRALITAICALDRQVEEKIERLLLI